MMVANAVHEREYLDRSPTQRHDSPRATFPSHHLRKLDTDAQRIEGYDGPSSR